MEVTLRPMPDGARARIVTAGGVMLGPDHELTITDLSLWPVGTVGLTGSARSFEFARPAGTRTP
jgi:hypothetical protein